MSYIEINTSNILHSGTNIDCVKFDRIGAEAVFRLLMEMGATKDIKLLWNEVDGTIRIQKKFIYHASMVISDEEDGQRAGDQFYTLRQYLKLLIRFDRSAWKRMKNVEHKIMAMHAGIDSLAKQLN